MSRKPVDPLREIGNLRQENQELKRRILELERAGAKGAMTEARDGASNNSGANNDEQFRLITEKNTDLRDQLLLATRAAGIATWDWDIANNRLDWDDQMFALYGRERKNFRHAYEAWLEAVHPDDLERANLESEQARKLGQDYISEFRIILPDGSEKRIGARGKVFLDKDGIACRMVGVNLDQTMQMQFEANLIKEKQLHSFLNEVLNDCIFKVEFNRNRGYETTIIAGNFRLATGRSPGVIGHPDGWSRIIHPDDLPELMRCFNRMMVEREKIRLEVRFIADDGSIRWLEVVAWPMEDQSSPEVRVAFGGFRNITERKLSEELLRVSEERFRAISEYSFNSICILNTAGKVIWVNDAMLQLAGYPKEIVYAAESFAAFLAPESAQFVLSNFMKFVNRQEYENHYHFYLVRSDGEKRLCEKFMSHYEDNNGDLNLIISMMDVTDRSIAEQELVRSEQALRQREIDLNQAQEIAMMGSWEYELMTGKYTWSRNNYLIAGFRPFDREVTLDIFMQMVLPEDRPRVAQSIDHAIASATPVSFELRLTAGDGQVRWLQNNVVPIGTNGMITTLKGVSIDITEIKRKEQEILDLNAGLEKKIAQRTFQLEEINDHLVSEIDQRKAAELELLEAIGQAEKANKAKSEFLSRMSHELRTPMNAILGYAQLMNMGELDVTQKKSVGHILKSGKHLLDLINEVLDISGIEAGRLTLSFEPVRLTDLFQDMMDLVGPLAVKKRISIDVEESGIERKFVLADRQRLHQVLINLLNNAIKYNREGGRVTVHTGVVKHANEEKQVARISISDTGPGIDPGDFRKLFVPFERFGPAMTLTEGTGLGLAVVKKLMLEMNGIVGVDSDPGKGSTFWIELPLCTPPANSGKREVIRPMRNVTSTVTNAGTILYIEDNLSNIELVGQILSSERPNLILVTSMYGKNAVNLAIKHKPEVIFLDLNLPDMYGGDVLVQLRDNENTRHIPVVIISADAMPAHQKKFLHSGAKNYLTKPLDIELFLTEVDIWTSNDVL